METLMVLHMPQDLARASITRLKPKYKEVFNVKAIAKAFTKLADDALNYYDSLGVRPAF
jgi:hypothetical protein